MSTFIIQVNPTNEGESDAFIIYNPLGSPSADEVRKWAHEGSHQLHKLRLSDEDLIQVDDATSGALVDPATVTGIITELPVSSRRKRTA